MLKVAVLGASGRMGRTLVRCIAEADDLSLTGAVTDRQDRSLGSDAGDIAGVGSLGVSLTDDRSAALSAAEVAVDFTLPAALAANIDACVGSATPLVVGTTGLDADHIAAMQSAAERIPLVYGRNMSVGVNLFMDLVARAAAALDDAYDVEIVEAHHRHKVDAPSGTALALGERVAAAKGRDLNDLAVYAREGTTGPRESGAIGFSVVRGGGIVGDHSVMFISPEERVELTHRAQDRAAFARGALRAARWVVARPPGLYSMSDVLGL